jgi:rfaE bifunctional protein nucleotidyltransferase chain/domain
MIRSRKIKTLKELIPIRKELKRRKKAIVFTNGCFDLLHRGHIEYLKKAKSLGDVLMVGINSDSSIRKLKGKTRPIVQQDDRAAIIASLEMVDYVVIFRETTPFQVIRKLIPDVLVKGDDYSKDNIVGREIVESAGGRVITVKQVPGRSTKNIIGEIVRRYCPT